MLHCWGEADATLAAVLRAEGCDVCTVVLQEPCLPGDLLLALNGGAVLARPPHAEQRRQLLPLSRALAAAGCPTLRTISGSGLLTGGDVVRLSPELLAVGIGWGTNQAGAEQLEQVLAAAGQSLLRIELAGGIDRLGQAVALLDKDLLMIDRRFLPRTIPERLVAEGARLLELSPDDAPAINDCLVLRPGRVLLPEAAAVRLADSLDRHGIDVVPFVDARADLRRRAAPLRRGDSGRVPSAS